MPSRENTFRVDYSQFPRLLSHDEIHKFIAKELGLTRENVLLLQPSRRLGCTFVKVNNQELAEQIVAEHDGKHEFVFDGKAYKLRITMEDGAVEVKLLELPESVTNGEVAVFLADYGEVISVRDLLWDDRYSDFGGVKTGVRVARMVVAKNIPSLVKIQGEETAVGYKGQRQTCLHCHEFAHIGIPCVQNKKLLVQKLAADQSYANVTKGTSSKTQPIKPPSDPRKQPSTSAARMTRGQTAQQKNTMPPPVAPGKFRLATTSQAVIQLPPVSIPIGTPRRADGNETDSSQASNNSRRTRRQPPGKKMRTAEEANTNTNTNTNTEQHELDQNSDCEIQQ